MKIDSCSAKHFDDRPAGVKIDTIVIHAMHAPGAKDPCDAHTCMQLLSDHNVSAHYLIDRHGQVFQTVSDEKRAWHAGESRMPFDSDQRENVNHFSIGIELLGPENTPFSEPQYDSLANLCCLLLSRHPISAIVGHDHIAPTRKTDPGPHFQWHLLRERMHAISPLSSNLKIGAL